MQTFFILKPDLIKNPGKAQLAVKDLEEKIGKIEKKEIITILKDQAEEFYLDLLEKLDGDYGKYLDIIDFMTSGPVILLIIDTNLDFKEIKEIIGSIKKEEGTLRGKYSEKGSFSYENCFHTSDSKETVERERLIFGI